MKPVHFQAAEKFLPLWWPCVIGGCLFMCVKDLITPPRRCCEARGGLFKWK